MLRRRLPHRRGAVAVQPLNGHLQLPKLGAEFLQQLGLALLHAHELLLDQADARQQALLHRHHRRGHVLEGALQLVLEGLLAAAEGLEVALKDGGDVICGLQSLVLQGLDAVRLEVDGRHHLDPADAVEVVLAAQVSHQLRELQH